MKKKGDVKKLLIVVVIIFVIIAGLINYYGIEVKVSDDHRFVATVLPTDFFSLDSFRQVEVSVIDLLNENCKQNISLELRRDFRGCYWGEKNHDLWVDGDSGILLYRWEENEWREYGVVSMDEREVLVADCIREEVQKYIDRDVVPQEIIKRLE